MFVIPCKYTENSLVKNLVRDIRKYHPTEKIVVVDSDSTDKSYFNDLEQYNVIIENIKNKGYQFGAYWYVYKKYPNEEFYYFMQDSIIIKDNLDYMKEKDLTIFLYFNRLTTSSFNGFSDTINKLTKYTYKFFGNGICAGLYFCKNKVMAKMLEMGADKILTTTKEETGYAEGCYGFFLEEQGYDLVSCSMFGDVFDRKNRFSEAGYPTFANSKKAQDRFFPIEKVVVSLINHLTDKRRYL